MLIISLYSTACHQHVGCSLLIIIAFIDIAPYHLPGNTPMWKQGARHYMASQWLKTLQMFLTLLTQSPFIP